MKRAEPIIQVGILKASNIEFILNGNFKLHNGAIYTGKNSVHIEHGAISFDGKLFEELIFESLTETDTFDLLDVVIGIDFHWERKENQRFTGALRFITEDGEVRAINKVPVEDYLTSVISSEMSATASEELLKAHAVISRSWLLKPIFNSGEECNTPIPELTDKTKTYIKWYERDAHTHFDVCADDHCQRYQGITKSSTEAVRKAIAATQGEVLMYESQICDARFSKSCGGVSETFENCWAEEHYPYLSKIIDNTQSPQGYDMDLTQHEAAEKWIQESPEAFCNTTDKHILSQVLNNYDQETTDFYRWTVSYSQAELSDILRRRSGIDFGDILDLIPLRRGESGRIIELQIVGTKRTLTVGKELEIRKWLSNSHLYSSAFVVDKQNLRNNIPQTFILQGAGWGHGVGLCQIGAAVMGEKGYTYDQILLHYFKGATLETIY